MEFDKTRVYTALNAEDLPIGSRCIFADDLNSLREKVQSAEYHIFKLFTIKKDCEIYRFDNYEDVYALAYLIELPAKSKYKPFESIDKAMNAIKKHGGWVERKNFGTRYILIAEGKHIGLFKQEDGWCTSNDLFQDFVFVDDGSPCGELVEE